MRRSVIYDLSCLPHPSITIPTNPCPSFLTLHHTHFKKKKKEATGDKFSGKMFRQSSTQFAFEYKYLPNKKRRKILHESGSGSGGEMWKFSMEKLNVNVKNKCSTWLSTCRWSRNMSLLRAWRLFTTNHFFFFQQDDPMEICVTRRKVMMKSSTTKMTARVRKINVKKVTFELKAV